MASLRRRDVDPTALARVRIQLDPVQFSLPAAITVIDFSFDLVVSTTAAAAAATAAAAAAAVAVDIFNRS